MKKLLKTLLWILGIIIAIILIGGVFMPAKTELAVSKVIKANLYPTFRQVNCLKANASWSPWQNVKNISYSGPECGAGATMTWDDDMDGGKQVITESKPFEKIKTTLDFGDQGKANAAILFDEKDEGVKVTWNFSSDAAYPLGRWMSILFIKPMIKKSYKKGLNKLDSALNHMAEERHKIKYEEVKPQPLLSISGSADMESMSEVIPNLFMKLGTYMGENKIQPLGSPVTIWKSWSDSISEMTVGFPVNEKVEGKGEIKVIQSYGGKALSIIHKGAYADQHKTWQLLMDNIKKMGLEAAGSPWEVYLTDPQTEKDTSKWLTKMYQPVK